MKKQHDTINKRTQGVMWADKNLLHLQKTFKHNYANDKNYHKFEGHCHYTGNYNIPKKVMWFFKMDQTVITNDFRFLKLSYSFVIIHDGYIVYKTVISLIVEENLIVQKKILKYPKPCHFQ